MTVNLSKELESAIGLLVERGQYASADEAMAAAARLLLRQQIPSSEPVGIAAFHQHLIGIGMITRLPDTDSDYDDPDDQPITIEGEPISETIMRERR